MYLRKKLKFFPRSLSVSRKTKFKLNCKILRTDTAKNAPNKSQPIRASTKKLKERKMSSNFVRGLYIQSRDNVILSQEVN